MQHNVHLQIHTYDMHREMLWWCTMQLDGHFPLCTMVRNTLNTSAQCSFVAHKVALSHCCRGQMKAPQAQTDQDGK